MAEQTGQESNLDTAGKAVQTLEQFPYRGRFIAIEGVNYAGKTFLQQAICAELHRRYGESNTMIYADPHDSGSWTKDKLLELLESNEATKEEMCYLFQLNRARLSSRIRRSMAKHLVICHRWTPSTYAYQACDNVEYILNQTKAALRIVVPDLTVHVTIGYHDYLSRRGSDRDRDRPQVLLSEEDFYTAHRRLRYACFAQTRSNVTVDGMAPVHEAVAKVFKALDAIGPVDDFSGD